MRALAALAFACTLASSATSRAQAPLNRPEAIEVDRDQTPPGQAELGFDGGGPIGNWALGAELGLLEHPIRFHTIDVKTYPVLRRETVALGGAIALGDDVIVDARMPLAHQVGQRLEFLGDMRSLDAWVPEDLTLGARIHVMTRGPVAVFVRGDITLPTGDDYDFAGDPKWSAAWMGIARVTLPHDLMLAATGGIRLRGREVIVADQIVGDELMWSVGGTLGIPSFLPLWCKPEQLKASLEVDGIAGDRVNHMTGPSPIEARIGLVGRIRPQYGIAVRAGTHLDDDVGAPAFRLSIDLVYQAR
jgi:hypothetical protein